jgi:pimeloyl-ACP methyl ester carboxylesterase
MRLIRILTTIIVAYLSATLQAQTPGEKALADLAAVNEAMAKAFTHNHLTLDDGTRLAWHTREGGGPTLVLIPGSWGDYLVYNRLAAHLEPSFRLIIVELRGHGDSSPATLNGSMELFADDVLKVVEHLKLERYYISGHSIGGMLAVEIAGREPKGLAGAIPIEGWTHHTVQKNAFGHLPEFPLSPEHEAERTANRERGLARLTEAERQNFGSVWRNWDGNGALKKTKVPMLQIWGDRNMNPVPDRATMQIPERESIEMAWIANASHALLVEQPEAVAEAINAFIHRFEAGLTPPATGASASGTP